MNHSVWGTTLLLLFGTLAGCTSDSRLSEETAADPGAEPNEPAIQPPPVPRNRSTGREFAPLHLNNCNATTTWIDLPRSQFGLPETPWDGASPLASVFFHGFVCQRIGHGANESINAALVFESTLVEAHPPACASPSEPAVFFLHAIYGSDQYIAQELASVLGVPFYQSTIHMEQGHAAEGSMGEVRWQPTGFPASIIAFLPPPAIEDGATEYSATYLVQNATNSARLVLEGAGIVHDFGAHFGPASLREPTILADAPLDAIIMDTAHEINAERIGILTQWGGPDCV